MRKRSEHARITQTLEVPVSDFKNPAVFEGTLNQNVRPHVWFFAISDCKGEMAKAFHDGDDIQLRIKLHVKNPNGSEFS